MEFRFLLWGIPNAPDRKPNLAMRGDDMKHTSGPWTVRHQVAVPEDTEEWSVIHYQDKYPRDTVCVMHGTNREANAHLSAAAPETLKELESLAINRHKDAYPINNLHALAFEDCRESKCTSARDAIEAAKGSA